MGQSGFLLKSADGLLCMDLYLSPNPMRTAPSPLRADEIDGASVVFGSHDHPDHIDRDAWPALLSASPEAVAVVPGLLRDELRRSLGLPENRILGLEDGQTIRTGGFLLTGVASAHERLDRDPATGRCPYLGAVIETQGIRVYQPGDTCLYEGLAETLRRLGPLDAMILPINGRDGARLRRGIVGNMTFQEAVDLAGTLEPGVVIPAHYDMFRGNLEDPARFEDYLCAKYPGQAYWIGGTGDALTLTRRR